MTVNLKLTDFKAARMSLFTSLFPSAKVSLESVFTSISLMNGDFFRVDLLQC